MQPISDFGSHLDGARDIIYLSIIIYEGGYLRTALRGGGNLLISLYKFGKDFQNHGSPPTLTQLFSKLRNSFCIWFFINIYSSVSSITYSIFSPKPGTS